MSDIWQLLRDYAESSTSKEVEPGVWSHTFTELFVPRDAWLDFMELSLVPGEKPQIRAHGTMTGRYMNYYLRLTSRQNRIARRRKIKRRQCRAAIRRKRRGVA